jgi:nicotinate dehydrogenase subunit B
MNMISSRRDMLKGGGALIVSFSLAGHVSDVLAQGAASGAAVGTAAAKPVALTDVESFLAIDSQGGVTCYSGKVDLGTGMDTALRQIVAEELDVPLARVNLITGDTLLTPDQGTTWGSLSIQVGGVQIRNAAAMARTALLEEAAKRLGAKPEELSVADGTISGGGKRVTYGELIGGKQFALKIDHAKPPKAKDPKDYKVVGKPIARVDIPEKVTGKFTYMQDFRVSGMLHGRVVRPPALGAKLQAVDESSIKDIPRLVKVVHDGDFLGIVAETEWAAIKASQTIKATWSHAETLPDPARLWEHVRASKILKDEVTSSTGNVGAARAELGARTFQASYDFAIHTHGSIGPSCAVAEFKDGKLTSWSASQATHTLRKQLATIFALAPENVRCLYVEGSGCYGRNGHEDAAADAALIALETKKPVRVQWMRQDEHGWDPKGPPTLLDLQGTLDERGEIVTWDAVLFAPSKPKDVSVKLLTGELAELGHEESHPGNIQGDLAIPYQVPNIRTTAKWLAETPFRPSWIRTPGRLQNTFANESFFDELAAVAGVDPFEYRLRYLKDPRGIELLERLRKLSSWTSRAKREPPQGDIVHGRGMSYVRYELVRTYVGIVADVEVEMKTGKIRVKKIYVAHDCGQIINPDGLRNQIEGNMVQTTSRTLIEEVKFDRSKVTSVDWSSYPILQHPDVPDVVIDLVERQTEKPWGAGEPSAAVVPSAIANAVFDATGKRMRSVPFTPQKFLAAT